MSKHDAPQQRFWPKAAAFMLLCVGGSNVLHAATVNTTADSDDGNCDVAHCTLREAITGATDGTVINFSSLFNTPQTISLQSALPTIEASVTIDGPGADLLTIRRDPLAANFRVFDLIGTADVSVSMDGITIAGGEVGVGEEGGGIRSRVVLNLSDVHVRGNVAGLGGGLFQAFANATMSNCTFSNNLSTNADGYGAGISVFGFGGRTIRIVSSTFSGNSASGAGGAIGLQSSNGANTLQLINSTITDNAAASGGGGIRLFGSQGNAPAAATLQNTIVAGNTSNNLVAETSGGGQATFQSLGFNLSNDYNGLITLLASDITGPAYLGALQNNGGSTPTHAPFLESPALDAGHSSISSTDQRGLTRPVDLPSIGNAAGGNGSDIGAVEAQVPPISFLILVNGFEN